MDNFRSSDNMLFIEKKDGLSCDKRQLNKNKMIETILSYKDETFSVKSENGALCELCGRETGYENRYLCESCWNKHEKEVRDCLRGGSCNDFRIV